MTVLTRSSKRNSNKIATRSTTNRNTNFVTLPYHKKHKNKRQPKPVQEEEEEEDEVSIIPRVDDDDGENSIASSVYSIIPECIVFSDVDEEEEEEKAAAEEEEAAAEEEEEEEEAAAEKEEAAAEEEEEEEEYYGPDMYSVSIDFDEATSEWMANKKRLATGEYGYLCGKVTQGGTTCRRGCKDRIGLYSGCAIHFMWEEIQHHAY